MGEVSLKKKTVSLANTSAAGFILTGALVLFAALKIVYSAPRLTDGNAYLYMARLITEGFVPYRDFFLASPPLVVYGYALFGKIFGFSWSSFNYIPVLLTTLDVLVIYTLLKKVFSRPARLAAALAYLFSFAVLATADFYSGAHLALTLNLLGALAMLRRRPLAAGALFGLAMLAKLYAAVIFAAVLLYFILRRQWPDVVKSVLSFTAVVGSVCLIFWWLAGQPFWQQVLLNHLAKAEGIPKARVFKFFVLHDWWLILAVPLSFYWKKWIPGIIILPLLLLGTFLAVYPDMYYLYFKMVAPWLALLLGWNVAHVWRSWPGWKTGVATAVLLLAVVGTGVWQWHGRQARAAVITDFNKIAETVGQLTEEGRPIYGDYTLTPLLALAAGRPIAGRYVDTNSVYFDTGVFDYEKRAEKIRGEGVNTIITKAVFNPDGRLLAGPGSVLPLSFFEEHCQPASVFPLERDYSHNAVIVWQCGY